MDWRLLVKERITKIAKLKNPFVLESLGKILLGGRWVCIIKLVPKDKNYVLANYPTVHRIELAGRMSVAEVVGIVVAVAVAVTVAKVVGSYCF